MDTQTKGKVRVFQETFTYFKVVRSPIVAMIIKGAGSKITRGWDQARNREDKKSRIRSCPPHSVTWFLSPYKGVFLLLFCDRKLLRNFVGKPSPPKNSNNSWSKKWQTFLPPPTVGVLPWGRHLLGRPGLPRQEDPLRVPVVLQGQLQERKLHKVHLS